MKIGKLAKEYDLSIDTIRHYMDLGLLVPEKKGGHYYFDQKCRNDLKAILVFKTMGFTLNEIKSIFMFDRLGKLTSYQEDEYYKNIFINKLQAVNHQIEELSTIKNNLEEKVNFLETKKTDGKIKLGININSLNLLKCHKCYNDLTLQDGKILNNQIIDGRLACSCGQEYPIEDGILIVSNRFAESDNIFDEEYIVNYISMTDANYLDNLYKGIELIYKKVNLNIFQTKNILELGTGVGFFLRNIYNDLPEDSLYIAVDYDNRKNKFLKNMLERLNYQKNIIFICADFTEIPLKNKSIDIVVDITGSCNYAFENEEFLLKKINNYIKDEAYLFGTYLLFKKFSPNTLINNKFRKNFILDNVKKEIEQLQYKLIEDRTSNFIDNGGKYENYFKQDEVIFSYNFIGKR